MEKWKQQLEWLFDDGISIRMITDKKRNEYYEKIIKETVYGKRCIDVGFGTGLLSLIAIKHGAKTIRAYESNSDVYHLGKKLIKYFNLNDKIELLNKKFTVDCIEKTDQLIIHEVIGSVMYNESIYCIFNNKIPVCPSTYKTEFFLYEVSDRDIETLHMTYPLNSNSNRVQQEFFRYKDTPLTTGIQLIGGYNDIVPKLMSEYLEYQYNNPVQKLNNKIISDFTSDQLKLFESLTDGKSVCTIEVNCTENRKYIVSKVNKQLIKSKNMIIIPTYSVSHNGHTLHLKNTHWNNRIPWQESAILRNVNDDLYIRQNLANGQIHYWV